MPEISEMIFENKRVYTMLNERSKIKAQDYRKGIINYVTSALFFGEIPESWYKEFVETLKRGDYDVLFKSIVSKKDGELKHSTDEAAYMVRWVANCYFKADGHLHAQDFYTWGYGWYVGLDISMQIVPVGNRKNYISCVELMRGGKS